MNNYNYKDLIKRFRNKLLISQEEMVKMLVVSFVSVNRYENGHNEPTIKVKRRIIKLCKENKIEVE